MQLIETLKLEMASQESMFRAQLIKEDISRLESLVALANRIADPEAYMKEAVLLGWTPGDLRTRELLDTLQPFLMAVHDRRNGASGEDLATDAQVDEAWRAFDAHRIERLVGCLSRVPMPGRNGL